jgi:hypothetical protein
MDYRYMTQVGRKQVALWLYVKYIPPNLHKNHKNQYNFVTCMQSNDKKQIDHSLSS